MEANQSKALNMGRMKTYQEKLEKKLFKAKEELDKLDNELQLKLKRINQDTVLRKKINAPQDPVIENKVTTHKKM